MELQGLGDAVGPCRLGQVLFIREDEDLGVAEAVVTEHVVELILALGHASRVGRIDEPDQRVRVLVVVAPERSNLVLAADVPYRHLEVAVRDALDVEADRGDGRDELAQLHLVELRARKISQAHTTPF